MPPPYLTPHWLILAATNHVPAGPIGYIPAEWVNRHGLEDVPDVAVLPQHRLDRHQVRAICQDPDTDVLHGYVCAMAWGSQGARGGSPRVNAAWAERESIVPSLEALRAGNLTRAQAYNLFTGNGDIPGLGPSYFTKLLYFFTPTPDFYIMDQWTGKSINLLTGTQVVRMARSNEATPQPCNKAGNYQAYCEEVNAMAALLGVNGEQAEEMLMSKGRPHSWPWRDYVRVNWPTHAPEGRYSAAAMHVRYPDIPLGNF